VSLSCARRNDPKILQALARMQKKRTPFVELSLLHKYSTIAMQELEAKAKYLRGMCLRQRRHRTRRL
jgi:hypothetical protein